MAGDVNEENMRNAIDASQAAVAGIVLALTRLFVNKGLLTDEELREAFDKLERPSFSARAETQYRQIADTLVTGRSGF